MEDIKEYYIDHLNGSDETGDGSAENPWRTFSPMESIPESSDDDDGAD